MIKMIPYSEAIERLEHFSRLLIEQENPSGSEIVDVCIKILGNLKQYGAVKLKSIVLIDNDHIISDMREEAKEFFIDKQLEVFGKRARQEKAVKIKFEDKKVFGKQYEEMRMYCTVLREIEPELKLPDLPKEVDEDG